MNIAEFEIKARSILGRYFIDDKYILDEAANNILNLAKRYHEQKLAEMIPELFEWITVFVQKTRMVSDSRLDKLFELDDLYQKVYSDNRIKHDFLIAAEMAYIAVFNDIFKLLLTKEE